MRKNQSPTWIFLVFVPHFISGMEIVDGVAATQRLKDGLKKSVKNDVVRIASLQLTDSAVQQSIKGAKKRGADVKLFLNSSKKEHQQLAKKVKTGLYGAPDVHAKLGIVNDQLIVGSANFSNRSAHINKEIALCTDDEALRDQAVRYLDHDIATHGASYDEQSGSFKEQGKKASKLRDITNTCTPAETKQTPLKPLITLSSNKSKAKRIAKQGTGSVRVASMNLDDEPMIQALEKQALRNKTMVLLNRSMLGSSKGTDVLKRLSSSGVDVRVWDPYGRDIQAGARGKPTLSTMHGKLIVRELAGEKPLVIVSTNNATARGEAEWGVDLYVPGDESVHTDAAAWFDALYADEFAVPYNGIKMKNVRLSAYEKNNDDECSFHAATENKNRPDGPPITRNKAKRNLFGTTVKS